MNNIIPIFILISLGFFLNRKFSLDINTLTKINFYLFVPSFTFVNLYQTAVGVDALKALLIAFLILILNLVLGRIIAKIRHYDASMRVAFQNSIAFYNSGNIGIPLITLVFSTGSYAMAGRNPYLDVALTTQVMVLLVQNLSVNTLGFFGASSANKHWRDGLAKVLQMPTIYTVPLAILLKYAPFDLTSFFVWPALIYLKNALVPIALISLGVQLSRTKIRLGHADVYLSIVMRLVIGPFLAMVLIRLFGIHGVVAQTLLISTAVPTAVNSALIAVECDNHPDFSSQVVMTSTILSGVTLIGVIYLAMNLYPL